jgi:PKHD-type hydroxylase
MTYLLNPDQRPNYSTFCFYEKAFTPEECDKIIALGLAQKIIDGDVSDGKETAINPQMRQSKISWIPWSEETGWIYDRLCYFAASANSARYGFNMTGFTDDLQFTTYEGKMDHYDWHKDHGPGKFSNRKLSITVQLSEPDYMGGDLEFYGIDPAPRGRGTVIVFPSFELHRVSPVMAGTRQSLVAWVVGSPFA